MKQYFIIRVQGLLNRVTLSCLEKNFFPLIEWDKKYEYDDEAGREPRVYIQMWYMSPCSTTGEVKEWRGRKWYLSEHMTDSEIIFTAFAAFKAAVEHEILEGFRVDEKVLINPHVDFEELLKISEKEVKRK